MPNKNNTVLMAIWAIACIPLCAAMIMYFAKVGVPDSRANNGELLQPGSSLSLLGLDNAIQQQFEQPRWLLLVTAPDSCTQQCQQWLYQLGQIKTALGRDTDRVEYRLLQPAQTATATAPVMTPNAGPISPVVTSGDAYQAAIWVADPLGNLVLRYSFDQEPEAVLDDLKRLLKVSKIG